jgi:hypothetical protein
MSRLFSEAEAAEIIRKASLLKVDGVSDRDGLTEEELLRVAAELGVPKEHVLQAIKEAFATTEYKRALGLTLVQEAALEGEIEPDRFDLIIEQLKLDRSNNVSQIGRSLQGQVVTGWNISDLNVTSRSGRTDVKMSSSSALAIGGILFPATVGILAAVTEGLQSGRPLGIILAISFAILCLGLFLTRFAARASHKQAKKTFDGLVETITKQIGADQRADLAGTRLTAPLGEEPQAQRLQDG